MENRSHALIAGVFTILLSIAAIMSIWWFAGTHEKTREYIAVSQNNVIGLNPQAQVRYRGIWVGKVDDIRLDPHDPKNILIKIKIREEVPVTPKTIAKLSYQGVTGIASILLEDGRGEEKPFPNDGKIYHIAMHPSLIEEISESAEGLFKEARAFLHNVNSIMTPDAVKSFSGFIDHIEKAAAQLEPLGKNVNEVSIRIAKFFDDENLKALHLILTNVNNASAELQPLIADARQLIKDIDQASRNVDQFVSSLDSSAFMKLSRHLDAMTQYISKAAQQMKQTLETVQQDPQSLIFGSPKQTPGPGEKGFVLPEANGEKG